MGIYIKGMEMPKNCKECFACKAELSQEKKVIYVCCFAQTDCPLIPVPPHGRLGDLDELFNHLDEWHLTNNPVFTKEEAFYVRTMLAGIAEAPTIIPADESNMDSFIRIFEEDDEEDGMDSFIRILKD